MPSVNTQISVRPAETNAWTLKRVRDVARHALAFRDRGLPRMAEIRNFDIKGASGPLEARLYVPLGAPAKGPLLLFFHGGGFVLCDLDTHDALCTRLADAAGMRVLSCAYRLAPEHPWPSQLEDAKAAARWVASHARRLGGHRRRLLIGGDSAGGYLALATAAAMKRAFVGQVVIYPLMHLEDDVWAKTMGAHTRAIGRLAVRFIEGYLSTGGARAPSLFTEGALAPLPTLIARGGHLDPCGPDGGALADHLRSLGARVEDRVYPGLPHGFANLTHTSAAARRAVEEIGMLAAQLVRG
jgi:acetyl esterase